MKYFYRALVISTVLLGSHALKAGVTGANHLAEDIAADLWRGSPPSDATLTEFFHELKPSMASSKTPSAMADSDPTKFIEKMESTVVECVEARNPSGKDEVVSSVKTFMSQLRTLKSTVDLRTLNAAVNLVIHYMNF